MVSKILERLAAPVRGLHQAAYWLMVLTLASQVLALVRDRTFAHAFGAGHVLDLYYGAFRVPDLVFALVSSLVSAYVLIPRMTGAAEEDTKKLLSETITFLVIVGGGLCLVLGVFAPQLLALLYPTFVSSPEWPQFVLLARILLAQPIILGISGIVTSTSQVHSRFVLYALSPVLYNLGIIFGTLVLFPWYGLPGIGIGVLLGAFGNVIIHLPMLRELNIVPHIAWPTRATMVPIVRDSIPRSLALGMGSFTALGLTAIAGQLSTGSISTFTFASNLEAVPLSLIGASYAVAAFPALSASAGKDPEKFRDVLSMSARQIVLWSTVLIGLIIVLRAYIVRIILGSGAFDWNATRLTAALLGILVIGLVAQGLVLLFSRALYAAKQSWRPLLYQIGGFFVTLGVAYGILKSSGGIGPVIQPLETLLRVSHVPGTAVLVLAFAATLGQIAVALASIFALYAIAPRLARELLRPLYQGVAATVVGGVVAYASLSVTGGIAPLSTLYSVFFQGLLAGVLGLGAALVVLGGLKNAEFLDMYLALKKRVSARRALPAVAEEPVQL